STGGYESRVLTLHKWLGIAVGAMTVAAWLVELFRKRLGGGAGWLWSYRGLLAATMVALLAAGHQGGNLTHGSDYLTKEAPQFVRDWMDEFEPAATTASASEMAVADPGKRRFLEKI